MRLSNFHGERVGMRMQYKAPWKFLKERQLRPKKTLGQNFLADPSTAALIIRKSGLGPEDSVLEIGAGLGALTLPLSHAAKRVYAVEKDAALAGLLQQQLRKQGIENVSVKNTDIFDVDPSALCAGQSRGLHVFGNLPYYISSQVLFYLIQSRWCIRQADLMFQKEVAQRLTGVPCTKSYSRLSVIMQYYTEIRRTATVGAHLFWPSPKVDSEVLQFRFKPSPEPVLRDEARFLAVVKAAFGKRRKTLQNALLSSELGAGRDALMQAFAQTGINPQSRAETLTVEQFVHLANALS
jgi:16S rRNA (adenine1518-N6/adenine1519-N6)-dimethyltransferase